MIGVSFAGLDLQSGGICVTDTDVFSAPKNTIQGERLAEADGAIIVKATYEPKLFTVDGYMTAATISALDTLLDTFKAALNVDSANFDIDYAGSTRRYVATPQNIVISRPKGLNTATFSLQMYCPSPVGSDTSTSTLLASTAISTATATPSITPAGSYMTEPYITITFTAISGGISKFVTITNGSTLRGMSIFRNWLTGDVLEIDSLNKTVYVNHVAVPFIGEFPTWDPGAGSISYLDTFTTSRTASIIATYTRRFL